MAGGAFDAGTQIGAEHNPLTQGGTQNLRVDPAQLALVAAQFLQKIVQIIEDEVVTVIRNVTGIDLSSLETLINTDFLTALLSGDFITALTDLGSLLTSSSPLNAFNIFGTLLSGQIPLIGVAQIGQSTPNMLTNPVLDTAGSVQGNGMWDWDGVKGRTTAGSLHTTGGSVLREIVSNEIEVTQGQTVNFSGYAQWASLAYSGTTHPIGLGYVAYLAGARVDSQTTGGPTSPGPNQSSWPGSPYTMSYPVPTGVDTVRMCLTLSADVTAGDLWWDDLSMTKTGLMPQSFVSGLVDTFTSVFAAFGGGLAELTNFVPNLLTLLHIGDPSTLAGSTGAFDPTGVLTNWITGLINPLNLLAPLIGGTIPVSTVPPLNASQTTSGTFADAFIPGLGTLLTALFGGLTGGSVVGGGTAPGQTDVGTATQNQTITIAQLAAAVNSLNAQLAAAQTSTIIALDAFTRKGSNLDPTLWDVEVDTIPFIGGGYPSTDGAQAIWNIGGIADTVCIARYIGSNHTATTNNTETAIVVGTPIGGLNGTSAVDVHGRMSTDRQTSVRARVQTSGGMTTVYLHSRVAGVETLIGTKPLPASVSVAAGTIIKLICGTTVSDRQFVVIVNNTQYMFNETGTVSQLGSSYRERGMGWYAASLLFFGQTQAAAVAHWTSIDVAGFVAPPPPTGGGSAGITFDGGNVAGQDPGFGTYSGGDATGSGSPTTIDGGSA